MNVHLYRPCNGSFPKLCPSPLRKLPFWIVPKSQVLWVNLCIWMLSLHTLAPAIHRPSLAVAALRFQGHADDVLAVFKNLKLTARNMALPFQSMTTLPICHCLLKRLQMFLQRHNTCRFWGLGSDGTVGANKTQSKSSVTTPICMLKHTSPMTRRSPVALLCLTCALVILRSIHLI